MTVTRPRHPLAGLRLEVIGSMRRRGREEPLVVLPDGSKTLMPADWTDDKPRAPSSPADLGPMTLAGPRDLLHACVLVSALSARADQAAQQAASTSPCEEDEDAACSTQSELDV